ncbi:MAG: hypothetical protein ACD_58C00340G0001 [uncultured bacterium]|nr:MAG: hypothetical protein ACD_58C00340G0001 [uncultured bacterium]OGT08724.1 MAG: hypothetical protein A2V89_02195 [Gammaproteobacteria bacterium RBG_16_37_9]HBC71164.1 hypothetical protein [Coxiellaceae bacterium]HBS51755.1 hypothetical protein [Coxiellaceae bacterium]HBY55555.1 hypothetical protein [Coxiellaceae bacterium]
MHDNLLMMGGITHWYANKSVESDFTVDKRGHMDTSEINLIFTSEQKASIKCFYKSVTSIDICFKK